MVSVLTGGFSSLRRIAALGLILTLAACVSAPTQQSGSGHVQVALLVPGGSGQASDEILARSLENAARLAIADLGDTKIDLRVFQTAGQPEKAAQLAKQAVAEGAQIILGPVFAQEANAAGLAVAGSGVNVMAFSNNPDVAGGNVFILGPTFDNTASRLVSYAVRSGKSKIMIVSDRNVAGELGRGAVQRGAAQSGATIVASADYEFSQSGIVTAVPQLSAMAKSSGAQAIFLTADTSGALPMLSQLLREQGLGGAAPAPTAGVTPGAMTGAMTAPESVAAAAGTALANASTQFVGLTRWDIPAATLALPGVQGGWFAMPDPSRYGQYVARYNTAYGEPPHPISALAYDGIAAIGALAGMTPAGPITRDNLTQSAGFVGVNGVFRLLPDGTNQRGLAVAQVQGGQIVVIEGAPNSFGEPGF